MRKLLENMWSLFAFTMMLIGYGGLAFYTFKADGWASQITGRVFDAGVRHPATVITSVIIIAILAWAYLSGRLVVGKKKSKVGDLLVFAMVFAGIYFTYNWLSATL